MRRVLVALLLCAPALAAAASGGASGGATQVAECGQTSPLSNQCVAPTTIEIDDGQVRVGLDVSGFVGHLKVSLASTNDSGKKEQHVDCDAAVVAQTLLCSAWVGRVSGEARLTCTASPLQRLLLPDGEVATVPVSLVGPVGAWHCRAIAP